VRADGTITGIREIRGWAPSRQLFFAIRFSQPVTQHSLYDREPVPQVYPEFAPPGTNPQDTQSIEGRGLVASFDFGQLTHPLIVEAALSSVSEEGAMTNMQTEVPSFDFDAVRHAATAATAA
jgi:putative alpha-1,2-mannosidase